MRYLTAITRCFFCRPGQASLPLLFALFLPLPLSALEAVTLQLKWTHAFQFAGYYAAQEKGYYRDVGLEVILREAAPGVDPVKAVISGKAHYGVGTSSLLLARKAGNPVVVLAVVFQHSPLVLLARQNTGVQGTQGIHDLSGKRVMIEPQSDELIAYFKQEGIAPERLQQITHSHDLKDLIEGRVDAMSAYVTSEPYYLDRAGVAYQTYTPRAAGIDFYGDNLFTSEKEIKLNPERVKAFREASLRGWQYAMANPEEIARLIRSKYSQAHELDYYRQEAQRMMPLLRVDLIEVGYMTHGRWRHIAETYADLGLLPRDYSLDGFLYEPERGPERHSKFPLPLWSMALLVAAVALGVYQIYLSRQLASARIGRAQAEARATKVEHFYGVTANPGRGLLEDRIATQLAQNCRYGTHAALLGLRLTSKEAMPIGNNARKLQRTIREIDTCAQLQDGQLIILLGDLDRDVSKAQQQAETIANRVFNHLGLAPENSDQPVEPKRSALLIFDTAVQPGELIKRCQASISML